jgi:molybdopterin converting factor small subunit
MVRIKLRYLNVYSALTGKKEETVHFAGPLTLGDLVEKVVQSGGRKFKESILDDKNALRPHVWILVNRVRIKDLRKTLGDGDTVVFSLPPVGG